MKDIITKIFADKRTAIKYLSVAFAIFLFAFGIMVFNSIDKVEHYKVIKPYEELTFVEKTAAFVKGYHFDTKAELERKGLIGSTSNPTPKVDKKSNDILTDEQKAILTPKYEDLNDVQRTLTFEEVEKKYDIISDADKKNFDRLKEEKEAYLEKAFKQNKSNEEEYNKLKNEIETNYPDIEYEMITGIDKSKTLMCDVKLLNNLDSTQSKCKELITDKETRLKDLGVSDIIFSVKNNKNEFQGSYFYNLKNGKYKFNSSTF